MCSLGPFVGFHWGAVHAEFGNEQLAIGWTHGSCVFEPGAGTGYGHCSGRGLRFVFPFLVGRATCLLLQWKTCLLLPDDIC